MRLGRHRTPPPATPVQFPDAQEDVILSTTAGGRIPARVLERGEDSLTVAIMVPTRPLSAEQLQDLVLEHTTPRGLLRLQGSFTPEGPDVLRMISPRSIEVLQQRSYVRIRSARPVLVYGATTGIQVQSFTVDISGGGLLLAGPDTLRIGDELTFRLTLTPGVTPVTGSGRVVRIDSHGRRAVEFSNISDLDRRRLVRFIFECQRSERRRGLDGEGGRG